MTVNLKTEETKGGVVMKQVQGFFETLFVEVAKVGLEVMANVATAEAFMTTRRSVAITNISEHRLEIEHGGKSETLRITITNSLHLITIIEAMRSGKKLDLVLSGYESNRTGKREVLTTRILEVSQAA